MDVILQEAQQMLLQRRHRLARLYGASASEERELREKANPDWVDQASESVATAVLARLTDRERRELAEIDAALRRIERGTYGTCEHCGGAIGHQRLRAMPEARLCVSCSS